MTEDDSLNAWFCREVLPLEGPLMAFVRRNWRDHGEVTDLRQEIYERVLAGAQAARPLRAPAYVYAVARNHLINRAKRAAIVRFELVEDLERLPGADELTPHRHASAREELRRVKEGLELLPPRCREIVVLRKIEGLSSKEVASRLGIGIDAVDHQTMKGMRALTDHMVGGQAAVQREVCEVDGLPEQTM